MIQLGISAFYHDAAACIFKDGKLIAAIEEERFTEVKHDSSFPINSINWCLDQIKLNIGDVDQVCWYENPIEKEDRILKTFRKKWWKTFFLKKRYEKKSYQESPLRILKKMGFRGDIAFIPHHESHAAFSYFTSPFKSAAILTVDGVGEWETVTINKADESNYKKLITVNYPNSLGLFYSAMTAYLGFKPNEGEYKVMGLAPYGDPNRYYPTLYKLFNSESNKFWIKQKYFNWGYDDKKMFTKHLHKLLDLPPRLPEEELTQLHKDLAAAVQKTYEREFLRLVIIAKNLTGEDNLCLGGGCVYNGVANSKAYKFFNYIHIPFAPSDAGSAIGAVLAINKQHIKIKPYLGYKASKKEINVALEKYSHKIISREYDYRELVKITAKAINKGKIVAWYQNEMEFGARALGNRSILANPTIPEMREKLNKVIKKREGFRPFAPSVTLKNAKKYFEVNEEVPYMNQVVKAKTDLFPAATHVDGTCRVQTVSQKNNLLYYNLLKAIGEETGHEVVLNTSFNLKDQTITMTPGQALERFVYSDIDFLVIGNYFIHKR